ncbi:hypothetical protein PoMZ_02911 [Pyricularia oryzae]|uniref:Uncharacterized protein n=1 Tax=Pyricularia oryzae TaxID=318829 RepID=A0A4P7N6H4_PYROR|nr:hypothetical protein PoMZ_02911 [Pyricularia oryzae]
MSTTGHNADLCGYFFNQIRFVHPIVDGGTFYELMPKGAV